MMLISQVADISLLVYLQADTLARLNVLYGNGICKDHDLDHLPISVRHERCALCAMPRNLHKDHS